MIKKNSIILIFLLFLLCGTTAYGQKAATIQSARFTHYERALNGFKNICHADIARIVISELENNNINEKINEINPDIIIAIGIDALLKTKDIKDTPIVYIMVLNSPPMLSGEKNITGVNINISQERQLHLITRTLPDIKKIGIVYNPVKTGDLIDRIEKSAKRTGIKIISYKAERSEDVPSLVKSMEGKIDLLWMIPDTTVIKPETVEFMLLFSIENKTPILTFSKRYVEMGALISISADPFAMGSRAGELANEILSGKGYPNETEIYVREETLSINLNAAKKLGIVIDKEILKNATIIK